MRYHSFRIHHLFFMSEKSVSEYVFLKVVQSGRPRTLFWKYGRALREHSFRIHHRFFMSEESVVEHRF